MSTKPKKATEKPAPTAAPTSELLDSKTLLRRVALYWRGDSTEPSEAIHADIEQHLNAHFGSDGPELARLEQEAATADAAAPATAAASDE